MEKLKLNIQKELDYYTTEALNTLRTNISFCGSDVKAIMLTSCTPSEGKSTTSLNLAMSLAESGKKVIFIDADLRKSVLAGRCRVGKVDKGLSHFLCGQQNISEVIYQSDVEGLDMVFAGPVPPNPSELLSKSIFSNMLTALRGIYDYIIIDAPPVGSVIDAAVIAKECDGTIIVIEADRISYKFVQKVSAQLQKSGCTILGAVLNKVDMNKNKKNYGTYYGKYYGQYYGHE